MVEIVFSVERLKASLNKVHSIDQFVGGFSSEKCLTFLVNHFNEKKHIFLTSDVSERENSFIITSTSTKRCVNVN